MLIDLIPLLRLHAVEHRIARDAGIVDENVDGSDLALDLHQSLNAGIVAGHVPPEDGNAGLLLKFGGSLVISP